MRSFRNEFSPPEIEAAAAHLHNFALTPLFVLSLLSFFIALSNFSHYLYISPIALSNFPDPGDGGGGGSSPFAVAFSNIFHSITGDGEGSKENRKRSLDYNSAEEENSVSPTPKSFMDIFSTTLSSVPLVLVRKNTF